MGTTNNKKKHTDQYSNFYLNQSLLVKLSAIKVLTKRVKVLCSNKSEGNKELDYIPKTVHLNYFPKRETVRYQESTGKVKKSNERGIKLHLLYERGITESISCLTKRFN